MGKNSLFLNAKLLHTLSFISKGIHSIATIKFLCRLLIAIIRKAMVQITERVLSTKELVVQMTTAFFSLVSIV